MVTLLLILMMACNLWVLLYLTWERKESRKADGKDGIDRHGNRCPMSLEKAGSECRK